MKKRNVRGVLCRFPRWLDQIVVAAGVCCVGLVLFLLLSCGESSGRLADNILLQGIVLIFLLAGGFFYDFVQGKRALKFE